MRTIVPDPVARALIEAARLPNERRLANDPVRLARSYEDPADREVAALVAALLAFGSVRAFLPKTASILALMGRSPRAYVLRYRPSMDRRFFAAFRSRIYTGDDVRLLLLHTGDILRAHGTLEDAFLSLSGESGRALHRARLERFASLFWTRDPASITGTSRLSRGYRHLVADPARGGASKRWNLFLRWVVRPDDGVDLGVWKRVDPADLVIPLDIHVGRISLLIGLRRRRTTDWKAAEEVTRALLVVDPRDPVRFDFPLSHIGISERCRGRWVPPICGACSIAPICRVARRQDARNGKRTPLRAGPALSGGGPE
ncbi:MAG TPA: TIGR02757 family protein [Planctomycetota bacterium]|nr:TIGR02757 family protein [Planctomycetota bacterium]